MNDHPLTNGAITLRRFIQADAVQVRLLAGDPLVADTALNIPHPYPSGAAEQWIATHDAQFEQATGAVFAVAIPPWNSSVVSASE